MLKKIIPLSILLLIIGAGVGFVFFSPTNSKQPKTTIPSPTQTTEPTRAATAPKDPVAAVKSYAAKQFKVSEDKVVVASAEKKEWPNSCLGLNVEDKMCAQVMTQGYEVTIEIDGQKTIYRTNSNGSSIRIVKEI